MDLIPGVFTNGLDSEGKGQGVVQDLGAFLGDGLSSLVQEGGMGLDGVVIWPGKERVTGTGEGNRPVVVASKGGSLGNKYSDLSENKQSPSPLPGPTAIIGVYHFINSILISYKEK